ncbi:MAG TPA: patatin-like phospholipase family protein [Pseudobdellovibrionaceae bacterium]|jgi:predicted acylesterase/phospholipase RssA|nr:patatin-like phospholipase family protein [Pseudobdellovibrionaceae bacterium]
MRLTEKKKLGLVLSGGGIKAAAFHLGVCLALREKGFQFAGGTKEEVQLRFPNDEMTFKVYVGSSAGSFVSSLLAAGHSVESIIDAFERGTDSDLNRMAQRRRLFTRLKPITYRDIFAMNGGSLLGFLPSTLRRKSLVSGGLEALLKNGFKLNGLFTTKNIERYMRTNVLKENDFAALGVQLYVIATQLNHTRKAVFGAFPETYKVKNIKYANFASISEAVAASTALPPFYAPYGIRNQKGKELFFFDGEIRDTLSTHVAADAGCDLVIASYSIQPYHYTPVMGSLHNYGIPLIINQALYQVIQQKIEKHIEHQQQISAIMSAVDGYFRQQGLPDEHRDKLLDILAKRVNYKSNVDYIYIHPSPNDYEMFFVDHFSLNPEILTRIVQIGFKAAIQALRKHDL